MKLSIILPALNEEEHLRPCFENILQSIEAYKIDCEIIAIDDGSTDETLAIMKEYASKDDRIRVIHHGCPHGVGASFWEALDIVEGEVVCQFPADNETNPWDVFRCYGVIDYVDMVIPFICNPENRSLYRSCLSDLFRFIVNTTFATNFNYTNGSTLYRVEVLKELDYRDSGFFFQTDILIRQTKKGYLFAEVPFRAHRRVAGRSKAVSIDSFFNVAKSYLTLVRDFYFTKKLQRIKFTDHAGPAYKQTVQLSNSSR
jgi:dolichol-phosphate mannosyltransferase